MPPWLQAITLAIPARYMNVSLQTVFLAGDLWSVLIPNMLFMLAVGGSVLRPHLAAPAQAAGLKERGRMLRGCWPSFARS